mmetsp:Transcript_15345/g.35384  ORF Transcript_15345/g.35384 Transcript_15345/m.35384 type:complete len:114 (+) Transcript_15345:604-945(+)
MALEKAEAGDGTAVVAKTEASATLPPRRRADLRDVPSGSSSFLLRDAKSVVESVGRDEDNTAGCTNDEAGWIETARTVPITRTSTRDRRETSLECVALFVMVVFTFGLNRLAT